MRLSHVLSHRNSPLVIRNKRSLEEISLFTKTLFPAEVGCSQVYPVERQLMISTVSQVVSCIVLPLGMHLCDLGAYVQHPFSILR